MSKNSIHCLCSDGKRRPFVSEKEKGDDEVAGYVIIDGKRQRGSAIICRGDGWVFYPEKVLPQIS